MPSFLISGGTEEERKNKAENLLSQYRLSQFDLFSIMPELSIGISSIRELQHWLSLSPYQGKFKAAIINQAEKLTLEAQNSLLKTLEEPADNNIIILLTVSLDLLLPTVFSRCQIINLNQKPQLSLSEKETSQYLSILISLLTNDIAEKFKIAQEIAKNREEAIIWLDKTIFVLRKLMIGEISLITNLSYPHLLVNGLSYPKFIRLFTKTKSYIQANANLRLSLETLFLSITPSP